MAMKRFPITNVVGDLVDQHRDPDDDQPENQGKYASGANPPFLGGSGVP